MSDTSTDNTGVAVARAVRCRWRHAARINLSEIALTKLDVLDQPDEVKVCVVEIDGVRHDHLPYHQSDLHKAVPVRDTAGLKTDIVVTRPDDLPGRR